MIKKCKCKGTMREFLEENWVDIFVKDKWYEVNHIAWSDDPAHDLKMRRMNGGWKDYLAITELGERKQLLRVEFNLIFYSDVELRESLIDDIIS